MLRGLLAANSVGRPAPNDIITKSLRLMPSDLHVALAALSNSPVPKTLKAERLEAANNIIREAPTYPPRTPGPPWRGLCRLTCSRRRRFWTTLLMCARPQVLRPAGRNSQLLRGGKAAKNMPGTHQGRRRRELAPPAAGQPAEQLPGRA